jgi:hypothetical protein
MKKYFVWLLLVPLLPGIAFDSVAAELMPGADQVRAFRRLQCSMKDDEPVVYWWHGSAFSRMQGEPDRRVFRVEGMNIRACGTVVDAEKGEGFRMVSRELLFYLDPDTGEVLSEWQNPWTDEVVEVIHVSNDPVNQPPFYPLGRDNRPFDLPFSFSGDSWWLTSTIPLYYPNPLGGAYQEYVGGMYQATEMFNFFGTTDDLLDSDKDSAKVNVGWSRLASWLPWMKMGDRPGMLYFHTAGRKLESYDELSELLKAEIAATYPDYSEPPPLDDDRPNETSWTWFKKITESREQSR